MSRTILLVGLIVLIFAQSAPAKGIPVVNGVAQDHFVWPKETFPIDWKKSVTIKNDLPNSSLDDGPNSPFIGVYYVDLNEDGKKEMIVDLGRDGITRDFSVLQQRDGKWTEIGAIIGLSAMILEKAGGYYQLESDRYYGGGSTERDLYRFIRGQYRLVRTEESERGVLKVVTYDPAGFKE